MTSQFSPKVSQVLAFSREEAARLASRSVGPEHLLLAILREKDIPLLDIFNRFGLNTKSVREELEEKVREEEAFGARKADGLGVNERASNMLELAGVGARWR